VVFLLPSPCAADSRGTANFHADGTPYGVGYGPTLTDAVRALLPTPCARDWKSGASNLHDKNARPLNEVALLLPTPTASDARGGPGQTANWHGGPNLRTAVAGLPEAVVLRQDWAQFEPAIRRQESLSGREAPIPTETGPRGGRRLTAVFAEWLMWLPEGHVTAVPGLNRGQQLRCIGNGAVPAQAYEAYRRLLEIIKEGGSDVGSAPDAAARP
jgi:DNA (cytosine-5)-methyltransferase 1